MEIEIGFSLDADNLAEKNDATEDLLDFLAIRTNVPIRRVKENMSTQDAGTLLVALLASPAVIELAKGPLLELAKGISDWLRSRNGTITVEASGVKIENVRSDQVLAALEAALNGRK